MALRRWNLDDFTGNDAEDRAKAHCDRAREQWEWLGKCWFWLVGEGAKGKIHGEPYDFKDRRVAERERVRHGWTVETLDAAHDYLKLFPLRQADFRPRLGGYATSTTKKKSKSSAALDESSTPQRSWVPPPTIERDWAQTYPDSIGQAQWHDSIRARCSGTVLAGMPPTPQAEPQRAPRATSTQRDIEDFLEPRVDPEPSQEVLEQPLSEPFDPDAPY